MSDQSPPPKPKPGSLRDRIAAFENKGTAPPSGPTPPQPRPKPGGAQWKPKPPSPPTSPDPTRSQTSSNVSTSVPSGGGMSASDALESIGRGGSLKERMAALQGKGAFGSSGGPPPPIAPKPVERPKWKPPPAIAVPADEEHGEDTPQGVEHREASRSPPPHGAAVSPRTVPAPAPASENEGDDAMHPSEGGENDPEEEERQRRAAIAARMARLGGARFGMGPPIFAPKPAVRKAEPPPPAPEAKGEVAPAEADTQVPPSHEQVSTISLAPESEHKDESESAVPPRAPTSMPIPAGPRRAAPPRKKVSKPTTPLPEPPFEHTPTVTDEPLPIADRVTVSDTQIAEEIVEATPHDHPDIHPDTEQALIQPLAPVPAEDFHQPLEEPERQETEEEHVDGAESHADEESMHTAVDEQHAHEEEVVEEEDDETRRKRVAARLAQMGAFNPLAGPPPIPSRESLEEEAPPREPLDVEDEVNVDTEEYGETIPPPPAVPPRHDSLEFIAHHAHDVAHPHEVEAEVEHHVEVAEPREDAKVKKEEDREPIHRDGESQGHIDDDNVDDEEYGRQIELHGQGEADVEADERPGEPSDSIVVEEGEPDQHDPTCPHPHDFERPGTDPVSTEGRDEHRSEIEREGSTIIVSSTGYTAAAERVGEEEKTTHDWEHQDEQEKEENDEEMAPPRITRPVPPLPVNLGSRPTPPTSPLAKTHVQALRATAADEEERPASPDMPPRPVPPPVRSVPPPAPVAATEETASVLRRPVPPPTRCTSTRVVDVLTETPSSPPLPPVPTSPRPNRRPITPPIITAIAVQEEQQQSSVEDPEEETSTPQPEVVVEDEASARRRAIAERMARLGGIRFGAPPSMNPLVRPPLPAAPPPTSIPPDETDSEEKGQESKREAEGGAREDVEAEEEEEMARKQRIAAKLAGMGGMRLGMLPQTAGLPPASARRLVAKQEESESEDAAPPVPVPAPPQRPRSPPVRKPPPPIEVPVEPEQQDRDQDQGTHSRGTSDDGVQVEAEDSEIEEVRHSDVDARSASGEEEEVPLPPPRRPTNPPRSAEALPTPPPRMTSYSSSLGRPPIPTIPTSLLRRSSAAAATGSGSASSSRKTSLDNSSPGEIPTVPSPSDTRARPQSEYVMVEADPDEEEPPAPPPPRRKSTRGGGGPAWSIPPPPPPPSAIDPPEELTSSTQWELPSIPQGAEFMEDLASSGWSEDSTAVHVPPPAVASASASAHGPATSTFSDTGSRRASTKVASSSSGRQSIDQQQQLSTDDLMAIWGKVGVRVVESAMTLFDKSKRALVGDGSYAGFVRAVLAQVPGALNQSGNSSGGDDWGYIIYAQTSSAVQRRVSDIMPGDIIALWDAKFKGHKGLHAYNQMVGVNAGESGPLVGVVSEFDAKKSKVRVWQANQHVGQQTVENVSYRLEDLKSGQAKVFRVLQA